MWNNKYLQFCTIFRSDFKNIAISDVCPPLFTTYFVVWYLPMNAGTLSLFASCLSQSVNLSHTPSFCIVLLLITVSLSYLLVCCPWHTCWYPSHKPFSALVNCHSHLDLTIFHLFLITGSGPSAEEHDRVSGRCQHPMPGHPGHARRVFTKRSSRRFTDRCGRWTRQLEEPCHLSDQRVLRCRIWKGKLSHLISTALKTPGSLRKAGCGVIFPFKKKKRSHVKIKLSSKPAY